MPTDLQIDAFLRFMAQHRAAVLADAELCQGLLRISGRRDQGRQAAAVAWDAQVGNAVAALKMIESSLPNKDSIDEGAILEVGGGLGLLHAWLRRRGLPITSLEPGLAGHPESYALAVRALALLGCDGSEFLPLLAEQAPSLGRRFALIFSYNVLEHLSDLPGSLTALATCLLPGGRMRHSCPNYRVPYEPHFGLPLWPLSPRWLERWLPALRDDELWRGLNFLSASDLQRWAAAHGLVARFDDAQTYRTFLRLESEPSFSDKHPRLFRLGRLLRRLRLLSLLRYLPPTWMTPMQVTFCHPDAV